VIPLRDNNPTERFSVVCALLIAANVVVYLFDHVVFRQEVMQPVLTQYGPQVVVRSVGGLSEQYAMVPANVTTGAPGALQTVFMSMFLHANIWHVGGNMLYLWIFGNNIEDVLGRGKFLLFYFASGIAAAAAQIATGPMAITPMVGASGAVAGLMGAYLVVFPKAEITAIIPVFFIGFVRTVPAIFVIGFWAILQFTNASWLGGGELRGGGVAYYAHIGGFLAGIIMIYLLGGRRLSDRRRSIRNTEYYFRR
jgi:membrane associated rhomboid family serine protease